MGKKGQFSTGIFKLGVKDWEAEIWEDILKLYYDLITEQDIEEKYSNLYAISRLTVSTSNVLNRFKTINQGKAWNEQIKLFNFFNVGFQTIEEDGNVVKPLAPFSKDPQKIVYESFIDYHLTLKDKPIGQLFNFFIYPIASVFSFFAHFVLLPPTNFK